MPSSWEIRHAFKSATYTPAELTQKDAAIQKPVDEWKQTGCDKTVSV